MAENKKIIYRVARSRREIEKAFSLVYKEYASRGYIPKHYKSNLRISLYNAVPSTITFVAVEGKKVVATVTLIPDSPLGIPMDKIYKDEVDGLRKRGFKVAEVSQLSIDSKLFPKSWFSMFNFGKLIFVFKLFKAVLDYALYVAKLDELCIAVNPAHQYLYKFLFFEDLGKLKYYGSVNKAPAIAKHLNINIDMLGSKVKRQRIGLYKIFLGGQTDLKFFKNKFTFKPLDLKYFFIQKSDCFQKASRQQLAYIKSCYPEKEIKKIFNKNL